MGSPQRGLQMAEQSEGSLSLFLSFSAGPAALVRGRVGHHLSGPSSLFSVRRVCGVR